MSRIWVERAAQFVTEELTHLAEGAVAHTGSAASAARLQLPDHSRFHERAEALAPLLQARAHYIRMIYSGCLAIAQSMQNCYGN
jgi:hypothetical protein